MRDSVRQRPSIYSLEYVANLLNKKRDTSSYPGLLRSHHVTSTCICNRTRLFAPLWRVGIAKVTRRASRLGGDLLPSVSTFVISLVVLFQFSLTGPFWF